jgi:hypothetical protein
MGSRQALSNGNEPEELTDLVAAFEQQNTCKIILSASLALHNGYLDLCWTATAVGGRTGVLEASPSDLLSVVIWGGAYKTLMGVVTRLLYMMDFTLAEAEFAKTIKPKA